MKKLLFLFLWVSAYASHPPVFPGTVYHSDIPTLQHVIGFDFGHQITMIHEAMTYAQALAQASDKVSFLKHGETFERRPLAKLFISSPENLAKLETFQKSYQALADPTRTSPEQMEKLLEGLPVLVLLQESVHGNEISGTDSGLLLAYHLAAAQQDKAVEQILRNAIVMIEISQNPDGRDRFVTFSRQNRAVGGDPDPQAAEREEPWASGRSNHYLFDMNRDWFAMTQPETKAKVKMFLEWFPQVSVDLHEMGSESTFFAANPSPPANPMLSADMMTAYQDLGKAIAKLFDARGIDYFQGEVFDSFYPGYGEAWPSLHGTVGVLFEQASARGLVYRRKDGSLLYHREAVANQALGSFAVVQHSAENREKFLRFFYNNRMEPMKLYKEDNQVFLLPGHDPLRMLELGHLLQAQGIIVEQIEQPIANLNGKSHHNGPIGKHQIPAGSLLVRFNQPAGKLARTLLIDHVDMDAAFIEAEQKRYHIREYSQIYDITAWSLPHDFGVESILATGSGWRGSGKQTLSWNATVTGLDETLAYFIPYTAKTGKIIADMLQQGIRPHFSDQPIRFAGQTFGPGSLIVKRAGHDADLPQKLKALVEAHGVSMTGTSNGWFESGPSLGSERVYPILPFRAAMLWDEPTRTLSAGWLRYTIEQELGFAVTALQTGSLSHYDLSPYKVLFIPSASAGGLNRALGSGGSQKIKDWVRAGGVLIALDQSVDWLMHKDIGLLDSARELAGGELAGSDQPSGPPKKPEDKPEDMLRPQQEYPRGIPGALLQVEFDTNHWLAFGMKPNQAVMVNSDRIYRPIRLDAGRNVGIFSEESAIHIAGFTDPATLKQMAHKPYAMVVRQGRGLVVAFTEDPNFRGFMKGLQPLVVNALFFGPSQTY